jgi:cytochrome c biogenesis protein CcmG, thiol:disulfide interchange protein DsbE
MSQEASPPPARRRRLPTPVGVVALMAAAGLVVLLATRPLGGGAAEPSMYVVGTPTAGVLIGQIAPGSAAAADAQRLSMVGLDGSRVTLADFADRPVWLIFWKTACEPCEAEAPAVAAAAAAHQGDGLAVIGVDVWDSAAVVEDYAASHALDFPVAVPVSSAVVDAYGVWGAPTHYFIDSAGVIRDRYFGPITDSLIAESLAKIL